MATAPLPRFTARTLNDIATCLSSSEDSERRVREAIALLRRIVPHDRCAILAARPGSARALTVTPEVQGEERQTLERDLERRFDLLGDRPDDAPVPSDATANRTDGPNLVVPLVGLELIGLLSVARNEPPEFSEEELSVLSVVASQIASYLTELHLDRENVRLREEARAENAVKDEFLATVSHELRTPLSAIVGWTHVLNVKHDPATVGRGLEAVQRNARRLTTLLDDLLDVSRIVHGRIRLEARSVPLDRVVAAAVQTLGPTAEEKSIRIETHLGSDHPTVNGDPDRLEQVVSNLLGNAIKFTPSGGEVVLTLESTPDVVRLIVRDTGQGIRPDVLPHVFERFRQGESGSRRRHGGLGLGLTIAKHLVELHHGTIAATSEGSGRGATFTIEFPRAVESGETTAAVHDAAKPLCRGLRVLVVDDDRDARDLARMLLERQEAAVRTVGSADEALEAVEVDPPDVLVCDLAMPEKDGFALIRDLRALPTPRGRIPAVALTAHATTTSYTQALSQGFDAYLTKPIDSPALGSVVARLAGTTQERSGA